MADLLVRATDSGPEDGDHYRRGDVVEVFPTGWTFGRLERLPPAQGGKFMIVRLLKRDGITPVWQAPARWDQTRDGRPPTPTALLRYTEPELSSTQFRLMGSRRVSVPVRVRRRRYRLDEASLPVATRGELDTTGTHTSRWDDLRNAVENKTTGTRETNTDLG